MNKKQLEKKKGKVTKFVLKAFCFEIFSYAT